MGGGEFRHLVFRHGHTSLCEGPADSFGNELVSHLTMLAGAGRGPTSLVAPGPAQRLPTAPQASPGDTLRACSRFKSCVASSPH